MKKSLLLLVLAAYWTACGEKAPKAEDAGVEVVKEIAETGQSVEYQRDIKTKALNGYHKTFYEGGKQVFQECQYVNGAKNGPVKEYYPSGKLKEETAFKDNQYHGAFKTYFEDGTLESEGTFANDQREGEMKVYYPNGKLKESVTFKESIENGPFKEYAENGTIKAEGTYLDGKEEGELLEYDEKGELATKKKCKAGICCTYWDASKGGNVRPANKLCEDLLKSTK